MIPKKIRNYISGEWVEAISGYTFESRNPADSRDLIALIPDSNSEDVDEAVKAARTAFPSWSRTPAPIRGQILFRVAEQLGKEKTRLGDVQEAIDMIYYMGGEGRRLSGETVGEPMVRHPDVDGVSFAGSNIVGEKLAGICGGAPKDYMMETGGKNAIIIMDDANLELAVEGALWGGFGTTGQRCTASSRLIVQDGIYDQFLETLTRQTSLLKIGTGFENGSEHRGDIGPIISEAQYNKVLNYIEIGQDEGARLHLGGKAYRQGDCIHGTFIEPTIFTNVKPTMRIAQEEIFGPLVSIIRVRTLEEAISVANDIPFGLSSAIYSRDVNTTAIAERDLDSGLIYINASTIGAEIQMPFGGTKRTGLGPREAGGRGGALDFYTKWKVIYRDFSGRLQKAQIDD